MKNIIQGRNISQLLIVTLSAITILVGIIDLAIYSSLNSSASRLATAKDELKNIYDLHNRIQDIESKIPPGAILETPKDIPGYLEEKAKQSGIKKEMIKAINPPSAEFTPKIGKWKEYSYSIVLSSTAQDKIKREHIANFLFNVEMERPLLKTRDILISQFTPEGDVEKAQIYISHFGREQ